MLHADTDRRDTPQGTKRTEPRPRLRPILAAAPFVLVICAPAASEESGGAALPVDARVVWVAGDQVYLAARDSIALQPAMRLTFLHGDKPVATGEVSAVLDRALARAQLTSGA